VDTTPPKTKFRPLTGTPSDVDTTLPTFFQSIVWFYLIKVVFQQVIKTSCSHVDTTPPKAKFPPLTGIPSDAEILPTVLQSIVLFYLIDERNKNPYKYQKDLTFISNIMAVYSGYATHITHNLIWNINVDETLVFAKENQACLTTKTAIIQDPHGQKLQQTPLIALQMAGDRNPRKLQDDEKDYGLFERLGSLDPKLAEAQLAEWRKDCAKASNIIKVPIIAAMNILCQQIIDSKEITDPADFETYLNLPIATQFREALKPDPKHVARGGFLFPWTIFLDFMKIFEMNVNNGKVTDASRTNLGDLWSLKSDVFGGIVYPALQARVPRCDFAHLNKGIGNINAKGMPVRMDFSNVTPEDLKIWGRSFFFGFHGNRLRCAMDGEDAGHPFYLAAEVARRRCFSQLISSKNSNCVTTPQQPDPQAQQSWCVII